MHEKVRCPLLKKGAQTDRRASPAPTVEAEREQSKGILAHSIQPFDGPPCFPPLFPELSKQDLRMAMQYISHSDPTERMARIERVRQGIEAESSMRLTRISGDLDKGKGHVFSYKELSFTQLLQCQSEKAMALLISSHAPALSAPVLISTGFQLGPSSEGRVSGNLSQRKVVRKRPTAWKRKMNTTGRAVAEEQVGTSLEPSQRSSKRKSTLSLLASDNKNPKTSELTSLGYDGIYTVEPLGLSGGLAVFWKSSYGVEILSGDKRIIDLKVSVLRERRQEVWDRLVEIGLRRNEPWLLAGDFNELMSNEDKLGGAVREESSFWDFRDMARSCKIRELRSSGNPLSWGGWRELVWVQCRLDRCFGNDVWFNLFPRSSVEYGDMWGSDHRHMLIGFVLEQRELKRGRFYLDNRLLHRQGFEEVVVQGWGDSGDPMSIMDRITQVRRGISRWKKTSDLNSHERILRLKAALEREVSKLYPIRAVLKRIKKQLAEAYMEEERYWRQKCREEWLKEGDRNTKYFHNVVKGKKVQNRLLMLLDEAGEEHFSEGQMINPLKSSVIFGSKVPADVKTEIQGILNIEKKGGAGTYLGLPECFSGLKRQLLSFIRSKLHGRLNGWFAKALSQGGKEILLKPVCLALPIYAMTCFRLSKDTCARLVSAMTEFWWSSGSNRRKIAWVSWQKLCKSKSEGGLGFKDLEMFNQSLLGKQAFRIWSNPDSLVARVLKHRYFRNGSFMESSLGSRPSYAWRSILHGRELLKQGLVQSIGDGSRTNVWWDKWIIDKVPRSPNYRADSVVDLTLKVRWLRPPPNWLKCNVASSWTFNAPLSGAAWLLRDEEGKVLLHSRRAFTRLASSLTTELHALLWSVESMVSHHSQPSSLTTELHALLWSVESMVSHHSQRVIFETSSLDLRMALLRPDLFPQFHLLISAIVERLRLFQDWSVNFIKNERNLAAKSITNSVTSDNRSQSYVASGGPLWLNDLLIKEASATAL
ncbi:hypothetical protein Bca52824_041689 [Brassica carinata]|uniref:Uncharacterized protein n=1 Tax=Brassica carinata TaxID=52824 RepID=A0A8X7UWP4_BRACI|nr:hypothetical protein Bca52824_041689 [Brassica carinata]